MNKSLDLWWDRLLKLIELLRPKFYNKLTWLIVISGLGLMSKPFWLTLRNMRSSRATRLNILKSPISVSNVADLSLFY
ncbi:hypothetical protein ABFY09_14990, partial [Marinomonas sp. 5E14-1]|uniref:hypothetical protein n=1 Tax=Marinomonas sp. 5E14-1 TaxID=3153922 RepID=UPI003265772B